MQKLQQLNGLPQRSSPYPWASVIFAAVLLPASAWATTGRAAEPSTPVKLEPAPAGRDSRFRVVDYDPDQVVEITAHVGYLVDLMFAPGEEPVPGGVALGDNTAWTFGVAANHVFLKPANTDGTTNLTVVTNRGRVYTFLLQYATRRPTEKQLSSALNMRVQFRYPEEERARALAASTKPNPVLAAERLAATERQIRNIDYYACGHDAANPDTIFDDGRFTYMRYLGNRELPSIFVVNDDGTEVLANSRTAPDDPETIIVQRVAKRFVFRQGRTVGCVVNKGFDPSGPATLSGTVDPGVIRIVKGAGGAPL